jgi:predicted phage terminase large subunit-like protein
VVELAETELTERPLWEELGISEKQFRALQHQANMELARRDFWHFCKLLAPDFYMEGRDYLKEFCYALQEFYESDQRVLIINMPPRHGKSRTAGLFAQWIFGKNPSEKIITGSYNEQLSTTFSRGVRNAIQERKASKDRIVYSDIFPKTQLKRGSSAANLWTLEGQHVSYLATSPGGTVTGFGATVMILDDIVKNADEAMNETVLENHWTWFTNTMLSRLEKNGKLVIIATRWNTKDLSGRAIEHYKSINMPCKVILKRALQDDGTMLCDGVLDRAAYDLIVKTMGRDIVEANYNQNPIDLVGRLYNIGFQTYKALPADDKGQVVIEEVCAYVDTADQGDDFLCCIIYGVYRQQCYVLDVYFTKEGMEVTEGEVAKRLYEHRVNKAYIESNNGGRGFGRSVERILREKYHWYKTYVDLFTQSRNKKSRILSSATWCQNNIKFPVGWEINYAEFYGDVMAYQKEGKMKNDDAEDCLAGIYDKVGRGAMFSFN